MTAPIPENEAQRLEWLRQCAILDTFPEAVFNETAQLAAKLCRVPTAAINLVDQNRHWSKAAVGQDKTETPRTVSFCAHTILQSDLLIVPDTRSDTRFSGNPLVTGEPFIRFYAGAPLVTSEGFRLGALCITDCVPRRLSSEQAAVLQLLARQITGRIELMRQVTLQGALIADRELLLLDTRQTVAQQQKFLRDVLASVTDGRLTLCASAEDLPPMLPQFAEPVMLSQNGGIRELRRQTVSACHAADILGTHGHDLETAVGEAAMNAVVHSGGGLGFVSFFASLGESTVQVRVEDTGSGIPLAELPKATLRRGYSTAGTMGHGFKMILTTADRVFLLTGPTGTSVVLEQDRTAPSVGWYV